MFRTQTTERNLNITLPQWIFQIIKFMSVGVLNTLIDAVAGFGIRPRVG